MKKISLLQKFGGITALGSVSFMVGWLDGWMVGRLDGWIPFFFFHTPVPTRPYTRASRGEPSLRSEIAKCVRKKSFNSKNI